MFDSLIGHQRVKAQLQRDIEQGRLNHAYLLGGPEHIGKLSLLKSVVSQVRDGQGFDASTPLGQQIEAGQGPGLFCFYDSGDSLKVDEVRKIVDFVSRRTADGETSFCVIEHLERMTLSAANAFLKVLEEPSERFVFLMTTRQEKKLLPTIRSRVQFLRCSTPPEDQTSSFLQTIEADEIKRAELMRLSGGRIGLALQLYQDEELLERLRQLYEDASSLFNQDLIDRFALAEKLGKKDCSDADRRQFLMYVAGLMRHRGLDRYTEQLDLIQEVNRLLSDTQVNKRLFLERLFLEV